MVNFKINILRCTVSKIYRKKLEYSFVCRDVDLISVLLHTVTLFGVLPLTCSFITAYCDTIRWLRLTCSFIKPTVAQNSSFFVYCYMFRRNSALFGERAPGFVVRRENVMSCHVIFVIGFYFEIVRHKTIKMDRFRSLAFI